MTSWYACAVSFDYDLFVIGAGSGGVRAARIAATYGARVAVAEESKLGGTCVNVGCIPKKLFVYAAHYADDFSDARGFGWTSGGEHHFDWKRLVAAKNDEIARLNGVYGRILDGAGVTRIEGRATLEDANTVLVDGRRVTARYILIAVGGWPFVPDLPGVEHAITSNEAFFLDSVPRRVVLVGGGYIASEFACIFHGMGSQVTQLYRGPLFLRGFDDDVRSTIAHEMRNKGIDLRFDTCATAIERTDEGLRVSLTDGKVITADQVMFATGRQPKITGLGLDKAGVEVSAGAIVVDEHLKTNIDSIYAVGDVIGGYELTPVALAEGMAVAKTLFGGEATVPSYDVVPSAVFTIPPIGTVGLTEAAARERYEIDVYRSSFRPLKHTVSGRDEKTMMKLIVDRATDRVLGCHMVGADAGEIVQGFAVALRCGATKAQFDATIGIHPTSAEEFVTMRTPVACD